MNDDMTQDGDMNQAFAAQPRIDFIAASSAKMTKQFALDVIRFARASVQSLEFDVEDVAFYLNFDMITPEFAVMRLGDIGAIDLADIERLSNKTGN